MDAEDLLAEDKFEDVKEEVKETVDKEVNSYKAKV